MQTISPTLKPSIPAPTERTWTAAARGRRSKAPGITLAIATSGLSFGSALTAALILGSSPQPISRLHPVHQAAPAALRIVYPVVASGGS